METIETVLAWFGGLGAVVLLSVSAAFSAFKFFGSRWIEQRFEKELSDHKHAQDVEIQRMRIEIDTILSGSKLIQQTEFEQIQHCWIKMIDASGAIANLVNILQQYPDLDRYDDAELEEFLDESQLLETQKRDIRQSDKKTEEYSRSIYWHRLGEAKDRHATFNRQRITNAIIFDQETNALLEKASQLLRECITKHEIGNEASDWKLKREAYQHFVDQFDPIREKLQDRFQRRVRQHSFLADAQ